jgi:hypothetical protein
MVTGTLLGEMTLENSFTVRITAKAMFRKLEPAIWGVANGRHDDHGRSIHSYTITLRVFIYSTTHCIV